MNRSFRLVLPISLLLTSLLLWRCNNTGEKKPDVSNIKVTLPTYRFDLDLYAIDTNHIGEGLQKLKAKYPDFLDYFLDTLMAYNIKGNYNDTVAGIREGLKPFLSFKDFAQLENTIRERYPNTKNVDADLTDAYKNMKYYFPSYPVPKIIYLNLGLSKWPSFPLDTSTLCIALDMFLGDQFPFYKSVGGARLYEIAFKGELHPDIGIHSVISRTSSFSNRRSYSSRPDHTARKGAILPS